VSNLVIVSGDFCSGSTLMSTLFRKSERFYCLYEPLHERLPEYLTYKVQPLDRDHHFFMDDYYRELRTFEHIREVFDPKWGQSDFYLAPDARADDLYRYLSYLLGTAFGRSPRVMFKENRISFRLGWLRANFPYATIVHIYRKAEDQWRSVVRRVQEHHGKDDVGQSRVDFNGFNIATWCEDLKTTFPELDAKHFQTGFERFARLWELSYQQNTRYADISIDYWDLTHDFEATANRLWTAVGVTGIDTAGLKQWVVRPEDQKNLTAQPASLGRRMSVVAQHLLRRYGRAKVRIGARRNQTP
jgi:hypothetical protein